MAKPYLHPGPKRLYAALKLAGFEPTKQLAPKGANPSTYGTECRTMMGIAYGESSGNCWEVNYNEDSTDFGIWQINDLYEGDLLIRSLKPYAAMSTKQLRATFGPDPRNTFYEYLRISGRSWHSYTDNAVMARVVYEKSTGNTGFYPWVAYWNKFKKFSALDIPSRVDWGHIDRGIEAYKQEQALGYSDERIASIYLEGLTEGSPLRR